MKESFRVLKQELIISEYELYKMNSYETDSYINRKLYVAGYRPHMRLEVVHRKHAHIIKFKWERERKGMNIYLASPFFNDTEIERVKKMAEILRAKGHDVFVPMEHQNKHLEFGSYAWRKATWQSDVDAIDKSDAIYAIVSEGNYSDDGTAWEIGYAYAKEKPIVVFNEDGEEPVNLMISDSLTTYLTTWDAVIALKDDFYFDLPKIEYTGKVV